MNVLLLISGRSGPRTIDLSESKNQLLLAVSTVSFLFVLLVVGYFLGNYFNSDSQSGGVNKWYTSLMQERQDIQEISKQTTNDIDALALSLGKMEARSIRLDALGSRLATLAGLGDDEFNFTDTPAIGGPEDSAGEVSSQLPELLNRFTELQRQIDDRQHKFLMLESIMMDRELSKQVMPGGLPVTKGWLSSHYGRRTDPFTGKSSWHAGVDFAGKSGSGVVAVASGIVTQAESKVGFGKMVEVNHGNGYMTRYAHNSAVMVEVGDKVEKGQMIAKMGSTGRSTGPHVHFEVYKDGKSVNPKKYILSKNTK